MHDMAKRDRNHPSVVVNSLCNEYECLNTPGVGESYVAASKAVDPSRPTTANSDKDDGLGAVIDIQVLRFCHMSHVEHAASSNFPPPSLQAGPLPRCQLDV